MDDQAEMPQAHMEFAAIPGTSLSVSRVAIGTWAIGGWMWGGTDEAESIATIRAAVEHGINVVDTGPLQGGAAEQGDAERSPGLARGVEGSGAESGPLRPEPGQSGTITRWPACAKT